MNYTTQEPLVIIPAFNEAKNIVGVLASIAKVLPTAKCLVVDDGSQDQTANLARAHGAIVLRHPFNLGYGVALQTGYKYASRSPYAVFLQIDADGQHDPRFLAQMAELISAEKADVVIGSRFHQESKYPAPLFRRAGILLFNVIVRFFTKQTISDSTSGYQAFNRSVLSFYTSDLYPWDYPDADVLLMLHFAKFRRMEIPVTMYPPPDGKSMHNGVFKPIYYVCKMLLSILVTLLRGKRITADRVMAQRI